MCYLLLNWILHNDINLVYDKAVLVYLPFAFCSAIKRRSFYELFFLPINFGYYFGKFFRVNFYGSHWLHAVCVEMRYFLTQNALLSSDIPIYNIIEQKNFFM